MKKISLIVVFVGVVLIFATIFFSVHNNYGLRTSTESALETGVLEEEVGENGKDEADDRKEENILELPETGSTNEENTEERLFSEAQSLGYKTKALVRASGRYLLFESPYGNRGQSSCLILNGSEWGGVQAIDAYGYTIDEVENRGITWSRTERFFLFNRSVFEYYDSETGLFYLNEDEILSVLAVLKQFVEESTDGDPSFSGVASELFGYDNEKIDEGLREYARQNGYDIHLNLSGGLECWVFQIVDFDPDVGVLRSVYIEEYGLENNDVFMPYYDDEEEIQFFFDVDRIIEEMEKGA